MAVAPRVMFVGLDAAEHSLLLAGAARGELPRLAALLERARVGTVKNSPGFYVGSVWPSFWTGLRPTRHLRYCHTQLRSGSYQTRAVAPRDVRGEPFWEPLSRAGRRLALVDVPKTHLCRDIGGLQVVDWLTHDPDGPIQSTPEALARELVGSFGEDPIRNCNGTRRGLADFQLLRDQLVDRARSKGKALAGLLEREPWDLFLAVFAEAHCIAHQCWHLHDPGHPLHDPQLVAELGDPMRDVYAALDAEVGALLERAGPETHVFLLASHGMGPHYDGNHLLPRILRRLQGERATRAPERATALAKQVWDRLPRAIRTPLRGARRPVKARLEGSQRDVSGDRYFQIPNNDHYGGVRINLAGREPAGVVAAGAEYEAVCDQLVADLAQLVNLATGRPAARRVVRTRDLYPGEDVSELPDVLVEWSREAAIEAVDSPRTGPLRARQLKCRTGDHLDEGLFLAFGPGIRPGRLEEPVGIEDFAPTLAGLLGVELEGRDGRDLMPRLRE